MYCCKNITGAWSPLSPPPPPAPHFLHPAPPPPPPSSPSSTPPSPTLLPDLVLHVVVDYFKTSLIILLFGSFMSFCLRTHNDNIAECERLYGKQNLFEVIPLGRKCSDCDQINNRRNFGETRKLLQGFPYLTLFLSCCAWHFPGSFYSVLYLGWTLNTFTIKRNWVRYADVFIDLHTLVSVPR